MNTTEKTWEKFTIGDLKNMLSEVSDMHNNKLIKLTDGNGLNLTAKSAGMFKDRQRFLNQNDGDEYFYISSYFGATE